MPSVDIDINQGLSELTKLPVYIGFLPNQGKLPLLVVQHSNVDDKRISNKTVTKKWTTNVILFVQNPMDIFTYSEMIEKFFEGFAIKKYKSPVEYDGIYYQEFRFEFVEKLTDNGYELYL